MLYRCLCFFDRVITISRVFILLLSTEFSSQPDEGVGGQSGSGAGGKTLKKIEVFFFVRELSSFLFVLFIKNRFLLFFADTFCCVYKLFE